MACGPTLLTGMDTTALQAVLAEAQQAYIDLTSGEKGESYSYTQGDGAKAVTYTRANIGALNALIVSLQTQLGIRRGRRPIRYQFR